MTKVMMHKQTGELVLAMECWVYDEVPGDHTVGCLRSIGYVLINEHEVAMVLPHETINKYFDVLGDL